MMGTEAASAAAAAAEREAALPELGTEEESESKKKKKLVTVRLSQEQIDRILAIRPRTRPFPVLSEEFLTRVMPCPEQREKYSTMIARAATTVYKSREDLRREQDYVREELATLGYVERQVEVTDDEDDEAGGNVRSAIHSTV